MGADDSCIARDDVIIGKYWLGLTLCRGVFEILEWCDVRIEASSNANDLVYYLELIYISMQLTYNATMNEKTHTKRINYVDSCIVHKPDVIIVKTVD